MTKRITRPSSARLRSFLGAGAVLLAIPLCARPACAQSAKEHVAMGDREYGERRVVAALAHYVAAVSLESADFEALCAASRAQSDLGESLAHGKSQDSAFAAAARYGELAVAANPRHAEGHYVLVRAIGNQAMSVGVMDRIRSAKRIRSEALEALKYDSLHSGALHVLGVWHAEVMRVNGLARSFAKTFLGADVFGTASWAEATRLLEKSVAADSTRIGPRLDLGTVYAELGKSAKAREQFEWIVRAPEREPNDDVFKRRAADRLSKL
jgi:tetratricopeptide (TPR) repeat protein